MLLNIWMDINEYWRLSHPRSKFKDTDLKLIYFSDINARFKFIIILLTHSNDLENSIRSKLT